MFLNADNKLPKPDNHFLSKDWYVIYTKSRHEKKVAEQLNQIGIEAYCPLLTKRSQWSDRRKLIDSPLFNSYLFVKLSANHLNDVFAVNGVVRYIYWCKKKAIVRNEEIEQLKLWLNDFDHEHIIVSEIKTADRVLIKSGPFMNQNAVVLKSNGNQISLVLENLGLKVSTHINQIILSKAI